MEIRLNKYISESGICTRREADRMIEAGKVTINRRVAQVGDRVRKGDEVRVSGNLLDYAHDTVYIALNKPVGVVSTTDASEPNNIVKFVNFPMRIFNIGRLDKQSEGLILLTNDGDIVNKILRAENNHDKEYEVVVNRPVTESFISKMEQGVPILGTITKKCKVEQTGTHSFTITLTQGLNRQIRRMCECLDYEVLRLKRTRIMNIKLDRQLPVGQWRMLEDNEVEVLLESIKDSTGESKVAAGNSQKKRGNRRKPIFHNPGGNSSAGHPEESSPRGGRGGSSAGRRGAARNAKPRRSSSGGAAGGGSSAGSNGGGARRFGAPLSASKGKPKSNSRPKPSKSKYTPKKQS